MAMIAQVIDGISFDASQGEVITRLGDEITVGLVLLSRVHQRRDNFRCMNAQQLAGLRAAVDRIGFQSLVTLNVEADGTFGIIDGHHRFAEAERRGMVLLPALFVHLNKLDADMGMLSFNISADTNAVAFNSLLNELLQQQAPMAELSSFAGVSEDYLQMLLDKSATPDLNTGVNPEEVIIQPPRTPKGKRKHIVLYDTQKRRVVGGVHALPANFVVSRSLQDHAELFDLLISEVPIVECDNEDDLLHAITSYSTSDV